MSDYVCPYCGEEIDECDWWEWEPENDYETECPECERVFKVSYYVEPMFTVTMPEELDACIDCDAWDGVYECCAWSNLAKIEEWNVRAAVDDEQFSRAVHDGRVWQVVRECRNVGEETDDDFKCSLCGASYNESDDMAMPASRIDWCFSCGAKVVAE